MSFSTPEQYQAQPWDPEQGDINLEHGVYKSQPQVGAPAQWPTPETPQQLHAAGWTDCPKCHDYWLSPENKEALLSYPGARQGYFTCPKCKMTSDLLHNLPWHGATEEDYYPKGKTGGGTAVGIPMNDVSQIAENLVQHMNEIPGYGPIVWWHSGGALASSPLDGATREWGIEVKGQVYDTSRHAFHPGDQMEIADKANQAREMQLRGILGVFVLLNFRTDMADIYVKEMPLENRVVRGQTLPGIGQWYKRTGQLVARDVPFDNPLKDPHNPTPGPYSMAEHYQKPTPYGQQPTQPEDMPF